MTAIPITRITPAQEVGIPVTYSSLGDIMSLSEALQDYGYELDVQTGKQYAGFGRITVRRADFGDQFADEGDWLRVTNASLSRDDDGTAVWTVDATTEVVAYSADYPAQPYRVSDFTAQFKAARKEDAPVLAAAAVVTERIAQRRAPEPEIEVSAAIAEVEKA